MGTFLGGGSCLRHAGRGRKLRETMPTFRLRTRGNQYGQRCEQLLSFQVPGCCLHSTLARAEDQRSIALVGRERWRLLREAGLGARSSSRDAEIEAERGALFWGPENVGVTSVGARLLASLAGWRALLNERFNGR